MPLPNTFTDGPIHGVIVTPLQKHGDHRGWLIELYRNDEIDNDQTPVMGYVSETSPGITRGPHWHAAQTDHFVVTGPGEFEFCLWDIRENSDSFGQRMIITAGSGDSKRITVPAGVVHAYKNVSDHAAQLLNFPDALYGGKGRKEPVDEVRYEDTDDHPFHW